MLGTGPPAPQALQVAERLRSIQPRDPLNEINAAEQAYKSWCHHIIYSPKSPSRFSQRKHSSTFPPFALQQANKSEAQVLLPDLRGHYKLLAPRTLLSATDSGRAEVTGTVAPGLSPREGEASTLVQAALCLRSSQVLLLQLFTASPGRPSVHCLLSSHC